MASRHDFVVRCDGESQTPKPNRGIAFPLASFAVDVIVRGAMLSVAKVWIEKENDQVETVDETQEPLALAVI